MASSLLLTPGWVHAADGTDGTDLEGSAEQPKEEDFQPNPYTHFGDFNSQEEEAEDAKFFQFGRFFGISVGTGYEGATGNLGLLYSKGGFPVIDVRLHYWFDFNFALVLGFYSAKHNFRGALDGDNGVVSDYDINYLRVGADLRYYFDLTDAPAPIAFAGPFLTLGIGSYSRTQNNLSNSGEATPDGAMGLSAGGGMQFTLKPKKTFFDLEFKFHSVKYANTNSPIQFENGSELPNQSGLLYTIVGSLLFTW